MTRQLIFGVILIGSEIQCRVPARILVAKFSVKCLMIIDHRCTSQCGAML